MRKNSPISSFYLGNLYQYRLMDVCFTLWVIIYYYHYLFCCPNCPRFGYQKHPQVGSYIHWTCSQIFWAFTYILVPQYVLKFIWCFPCPSPRIGISSSSLGYVVFRFLFLFLYLKGGFQKSRCGCQLCSLFLGCHCSAEKAGKYMYYTHICKYFHIYLILCLYIIDEEFILIFPISVQHHGVHAHLCFSLFTIPFPVSETPEPYYFQYIYSFAQYQNIHKIVSEWLTHSPMKSKFDN